MQGSIDSISLSGYLARIRIFLRQINVCFRRPSLATAGAIAGLFFAGACFDSAIAQPAINSDDGPELRSLFANSEDVAGGKRLAKSSCTGCHGANGVSSNPGVPHLAGQRPAYLYLALKAYQARDTNAMHNEVGFLNDDAIIKLAAYFASLDPPQPSAANADNVPATDPVQAGKAAAAGCAGCHGDGGVSKTAGMPSLVGSDPKALVNRHEGLQERGTQERHDEFDACQCHRRGHEQHRALLRGAKGVTSPNSCRRRQGRGGQFGRRLRGLPRPQGREWEPPGSELGRAGFGISRERDAGLQAEEPAATTR